MLAEIGLNKLHALGAEEKTICHKNKHRYIFKGLEDEIKQLFSTFSAQNKLQELWKQLDAEYNHQFSKALQDKYREIAPFDFTLEMDIEIYLSGEVNPTLKPKDIAQKIQCPYSKKVQRRSQILRSKKGFQQFVAKLKENGLTEILEKISKDGAITTVSEHLVAPPEHCEVIPQIETTTGIQLDNQNQEDLHDFSFEEEENHQTLENYDFLSWF